jgi:DNA polymerase IV (DinB-like DNA polymerase)
MLVDLDYFFAQLEELRNPSLKKKPLVVCVYSGRTDDSGAVSTANYVAREFGVKSGMPIFRAKKKLANTEAAFLPVDYDFYEEMSEKVMKIFRKHADRFEQVGIDEAYLDVTDKTNGRFEDARALASEIKNELKVTLRLTCSIGIGPNKIVAKIAADIQKPDAVTVVEPKQVESFLSPLSTEKLIGVGVKTREKMQALSIHTVGDLAKFDVQKLIAAFGKTLGTYFHNASLGIDDEPVQERGETESLSRISTLKQNTRDLNTIFEKVTPLCNELRDTLMKEKLLFRTIGTIAVIDDLSTHTRSKTFESPSNNLELICNTVRELFQKFLNETDHEVRRVGIRVSNFTKEETGQKQLTSFIERKSGFSTI